MKGRSKRFTPPKWLDVLIPLVLIALLLALLAALTIVGLSVAGVI